MIELNEYLSTIPEEDRIIYSVVFNAKDYDINNSKFQKCYEIASNLQTIKTYDIVDIVNILEVVPADYVDIILDIASVLKPKKHNHFKAVKLLLRQRYAERFKVLVKNGDESKLVATGKTAIADYENFKERVFTILERGEIISYLKYDFFELAGRYKGSSKLKRVLNDINKPLRFSKYAKMEKIKNNIYFPLMDNILLKVKNLNTVTSEV